MNQQSVYNSLQFKFYLIIVSSLQKELLFGPPWKLVPSVFNPDKFTFTYLRGLGYNKL
jgi:hypothetical protein